jgi:uncharacterized membrane protein
LWLDEFFTYERANASSIAETIDLTAQHASQMPFYYIVIQPLPTDHPFTLRIPTLLVSLLSIVTFIAIVQYFYQKPTLALLAGLLLATNPYHIWLTRTARPYGLLFLLILLTSYIFLRLWQRQTLTLWLIYVALSLPPTLLIISA